MPWSNQGGGPWGSGPKGPWGSGSPPPGSSPPDLEELLRRGQDKLRTVLPGGKLGGGGIALIAVAAVALWGFSGFFRVEPDELGLVMRFGQYIRDAKPGLNYHIPYPVESAELVKVTRVNRIDIGMRLVEDVRRGTQMRDVPEESLMLTGDENIVDVDFAVFWVVKPQGGAGEYRFNINNPEGTVKAVAESAMREVVGRSEIQPILTGARQNIETAVTELMQKTLDHYNSGIQITQVQMQKVDPPAQVIDSFRDVQAARADRDVTVLVAEATSRAEQTRGEGDAERNRIFAEAYGKDPGFFAFYRSMQAYETGLRANDTRLVLRPDSDFFKYFGDPSGKGLPTTSQSPASPQEGQNAGQNAAGEKKAGEKAAEKAAEK